MITKKILAVILALTAYNLFFFNNYFPSIGSLGFLLLVSIAHAIFWTSWYRPVLDKKNKLALASTALSIIAITAATLRTSVVDQSLLTGTSVVLSFITVYLLSIKHSQFGAVSELANIPWQILSKWLENLALLIPNLLKNLAPIFRLITSRLPKPKISSERLGTVVRGLIITVPIVGVVILLLTQADPAFLKLIQDITNFRIEFPNIVINLPTRVVYSLILLMLVIPLVLINIKSKFQSPLQNKIFDKYRGEMSILVTSLSIIMGLFLVIQFKYLFASVHETQLHQFGVQTYSEYVRKGFSELVVVSLIVYMVSAISLIVQRAKTKKKDYLKTVNFVLLTQMLIFVFSIFRRVVMYQAEHGLTRIRVYGMMFLAMLIGLTVVIILRQIKTKFNNWYLYEIGIIISIIFITSLINVDNLVATFFQPTVNDEVDYTYITKLSADGLIGWEEAFKDINYDNATPDSRKVYYDYLSITNIMNNYEHLIYKYGSAEEKNEVGVSDGQENSLFNTNLAELKAYKNISNHIPYTEVVRKYNQVMSAYNNLDENVKNDKYDRSAVTPLL